jgi:hypothetical protein
MDRVMVTLRLGDMRLDRRAAAELEDYIVRIRGARLGGRRSFAWGQAAPVDDPWGSCLQLDARVEAKSPDAFVALDGIASGAAATTELGEAVSSVEGGGGAGTHDLGVCIHDAVVALAYPRLGTKSLACLEGSLALASQVTATQFDLKPQEGETAEKDGVKLTVSKCETMEGMYWPGVRCLVVGLDAVCDDLGAQKPGPMARRPEYTLSVVGKDGRVTPPGLFFLPGRYEPIALPDGKFEPEQLRVTVLRFGPSDKLLPFVIRDIALP